MAETHDGRPSASISTTTFTSHSDRPSIASDSIVRLSPTNTKEHIPLEKVEQTMLGMVWLRVLDAQSKRPILNDPYSKEILDRCIVDTKQTTFFTNSSGVTDPRAIEYIANRGLRLDEWTQAFLDRHESRHEPVTVLHLGCGLDCRNLRVKRGGNVRWVDLDRPMVVNMRNRVLVAPPGDYSVRNLDVSQDGWMRDIPADRPTLIVAEGLFPYIDAETAPRLIHDLVEYFGRGEMIFDVMGEMLIKFTDFNKFLRSSKSAFQWGVDDARIVETFHPTLKLKENVFRKEYMDGVLPLFGKVGNVLCALHPGDKYNGQFLRYEFKSSRTGDKSQEEVRDE